MHSSSGSIGQDTRNGLILVIKYNVIHELRTIAINANLMLHFLNSASVENIETF